MKLLFLWTALVALGGPQAPPVVSALPQGERPLVELSELRTHPSLWLEREVRTVVQFDAPRAQRDTYLSRYGSRTHWAFQAWGDGQELWSLADFESPAPRLFARRGSAAAMRLRAARRYERFELECRIGEVFLGEPWIEVQSVRRLEGAWNDGALVHATRAGALMESGRWYLAADQFDRALAARLPEAAEHKIAALRDGCRRHQARLEERRRRGLSSFRSGH